MAFPASDLIEKTYRNNIEDVAAYLAETHNQKYLIINVSSRIYDYELFRMKVKDFEWPDHQAPALSALVGVAYSIYDFLQCRYFHMQRTRLVSLQCTVITEREEQEQL